MGELVVGVRGSGSKAVDEGFLAGLLYGFP